MIAPGFPSPLIVTGHHQVTGNVVAALLTSPVVTAKKYNQIPVKPSFFTRKTFFSLGYSRGHAVFGILMEFAGSVAILVTFKIRLVPSTVHNGLLQKARALKSKL